MAVLTHIQAQDLMQKAADHSLTSRDESALDSHLEKCNDCRLYLKKLSRLQMDLRNNFNNRWNKGEPNISIDLIKRQSERAAMKNKTINTFRVLGWAVILIAAFIFINAFINKSTLLPASPISASTQSSKPTETPGAEAVGSTYLEQQTIVPPFPPKGIGAVCKSISNDPQTGSGIFIWPTSHHFLAGRDFSDVHPAIDIFGSIGDFVQAADGGVVIMAGPNTWGYGNLVILDHGNGWYSLYGHLDTITVTCGQNVNQGDTIGTVGKSGNTTKPELHFQLERNNSFVNPWTVLPLDQKCEKTNYTIQEGDTVLQIASLFNTSIAIITVENDLNGGKLTPGKVLQITICEVIPTPPPASTPTNHN